MTFTQQISAYSIGLLTDKDLPDIAISGLEEGYDSESLRLVAGLRHSNSPFEASDCFKKALAELSLREKDPKQALRDVLIFHAQNIVNKTTDTYQGFEKLIEIIGKTSFHFEDFGLMPCYIDYITIWEERSGGLDFHSAAKLTREQYIEKTTEGIRQYLHEWLLENKEY